MARGGRAPPLIFALASRPAAWRRCVRKRADVLRVGEGSALKAGYSENVASARRSRQIGATSRAWHCRLARTRLFCPNIHAVAGLFDSVILLSGIQGLILAAVLAARRNNRLANRILAALVGSLSLMLLLGIVERSWAIPSHPHLLGVTTPLPFLFAPLLYLYIVALTRPAARFDPRWLVHGLLFAADSLWWLSWFLVRPGAEKMALAQAYTDGRIAPPWPIRLHDLLLLVQAILYILASWLALRAYSRRIEGFFSDLARIDLRWLKAMVMAHGAVWSIVIVS